MKFELSIAWYCNHRLSSPVVSSRLLFTGETVLPRPPGERQDRVAACEIFFAVWVEKDGTMQTRNCGDYTHIMRGLRRHCASLARQETIDVARCACLHHYRPLKTNEAVADLVW